MPEDLARIAVLPNRHVQTNSSLPFTSDLLFARTCNQGKIVDICRPSAGSSLPEGWRPLLYRLSPSVPRPFISRLRNALSLQARCTNAPKSHAGGRACGFVPLLSYCSSLRASRLYAREQGAIQIYNDVARAPSHLVNICCWYGFMLIPLDIFVVNTFKYLYDRFFESREKCEKILLQSKHLLWRLVTYEIILPQFVK